MNRIAAAFAALIASTTLSTIAHAGSSGELIDKVKLQVAMQQYIDANLVDGAYLHFNQEDGSIRELFPATAHPMILSYGQYVVMCTDFRDGEGKAVNVDFYLAARDSDYVVFDSVVNDRTALAKLMKDGAVQRIE